MTNLPLPLAVMYAGLGGTVLALIVATIQNRWSLRVFFILALRLAIGWHFLFEGLGKLYSHYIGPTETNRPFTSEPYFKDADGPFAPYMRQQLGDPEALLKAKTEPVLIPAPLDKITDPNLRVVAARTAAEKFVSTKASTPEENADKLAQLERSTDQEFAKAVPTAVAEEWKQFVATFAEKYKLSAEEKNRLEGDLTPTALAKYGRWITGAEPRDSTVKFVSGDTPLTAPQRLACIRKRQAELDELQKRPQADLGNGYGYDMARIKDAKAVVSGARSVLIVDADAFLQDLKKQAFTEIIAVRLEKPDLPPEQAVVSPSKFVGMDAERFQALLTPSAGAGDSFQALPKTLQDRWTNFYNAFRAAYPLNEEASTELDAVFAANKLRLASWYQNRDEFTGEPKPGFGKLVQDYEAKSQEAAAKPDDAKATAELTTARANILTALDGKYADLKTLLTAALPKELVSGPIAPPATTSKIETIDLQTRWALTAIGAMLLLGLFTPLACLAGGAFLVLTYLTHPPFPWLPAPPGTEGNPVFVNKNAIEFLGLMVVLVHPTGRWMGIDAILHRMFFRNAPDPK